ncbi:MAG: type II toxin-antitoxin system VapC family toxin [Candidatus Njordarchaeia archaeon]
MELLDASAIINLLAKKEFTRVVEGAVIDLTMYELGNIVWKWVKRGKADKSVAGDILSDIMKLVGKAKCYSVHNSYLNILDIALENDLTFYDASYLHLAIQHNLKLITSDKKLYEVARKLLSNKAEYIKPIE